MTDMPPAAAVFAFNTVFKAMEVFETCGEAIACCPGLEIAEGDWLFFAANGFPLEAVFSIDPVVQEGERWVFSNGIYDLKPGEGPSLTAFLFDLCRGPEGVWMWPFVELEAYFKAS